MSKFAILIDGGFVRTKLGSKLNPMDCADLETFLENLRKHAALEKSTLHRIYFYDASPLTTAIKNPLDGTVTNLGASQIAIKSAVLHQAVGRLPFMALRMGELAFRGWVLQKKILKTPSATKTITATSIRPDVHQKGVDMRIGLDIASLTLKNQAQIIVLITGDSDFVPAMKFARKEGAQLFLVPIGHAIKDTMREHADLILDVPIN